MAVNADKLHKAKETKNDEFFTEITDIEKEMKYYRSHFKDATVFCNCDDPDWSNFWKYFHLNFEFLGLKKLITTHYDASEPTYKMIYEGGNDADTSVGSVIPLEQNGDFRSPECIELLQEADIVVTNPPFSLFREYMGQLVGYGKKFIILGNQNALSYKEIFPLLKNNQVWYGASIHSGGVTFRMPDDYDSYSKNVYVKNGHHYINLSGIRWFTNLDYPQRHEPIDLVEKYDPEKFPFYDNYDAINVQKSLDIPEDYDDVMGVPITFFDKYCPEQFEILGLLIDYKGEYFIQGRPVYTDEKHKNSTCAVLNGKRQYAKILIKRRKG